MSLHLTPRTDGLAAESLGKILSLPEDEIDLGKAVLLAAREERADLDVDEYLAKLDSLAARLRRRLPEGIGARKAVDQLVRVVQVEGTRTANVTAELPSGGFPAAIDVSRILDGAKGNCLGTSLLYIAVAERVGLPIRGVSAPEHFFVRFDDGVTRINIEPTLSGRSLSDKEYIERRHISAESMDRGIYLRSESKRQVLASLLANRAGYRALLGAAEGALRDSERALAIKPYWPQAYVNRGLAYELLGKQGLAEEDYYRALQLDPHCAGALNNLAAMYVRRAMDESPESAPGGDAESAEGMIALALHMFPDRAEFHETAAAVSAVRGNLLKARLRLRRAIRLDPTNERYRAKLLKLQKKSRR